MDVHCHVFAARLWIPPLYVQTTGHQKRRFPQRHPLVMSSLCLTLFGRSVLMQQMPTNHLPECIYNVICCV